MPFCKFHARTKFLHQRFVAQMCTQANVRAFECVGLLARVRELSRTVSCPTVRLGLAATASVGTLALTFHPDCLCQSNSSSSSKILTGASPTPHPLLSISRLSLCSLFSGFPSYFFTSHFLSQCFPFMSIWLFG